MKPLLLGLAIASLSTALTAQSVTIAPSRDNTLYQTGMGELSNGGGSRIFAGRTGGGARRRGILSFDIAAAVPAGAVVTGVTFEITETMTSIPLSLTYFLHRTGQDWGEGTTVAPGGQGAGAAANPGDVTWDSTFFGSGSWASPGGDFDPAPSASATWSLTGSATQTMTGPGLVQDVQAWLDDPATNFGWVLKSDELSAAQISAFHSRESMTPPQLTIAYAMPTVVTLTPSRDNTLYDTFGETTNGGGTRIFAGRTLGLENRRAILGFDVAGSIPAGATITAVDLQITEVMNAFGGSAPFSLHAVSQDWGEGTSVAPRGQGGGGVPQPGDVTWLSTFFGSANWTTPGGDFDLVASATEVLTLGGGGTRTIGSTPGMVQDAQTWLDMPVSNFGWILKTDEAVDGAVAAYGSRESMDPPQLTITYLPPSGPVAQNIPFGTGCAAPSGGSALTLTGVSVPSLGNSSYALQIGGGAPAVSMEAIAAGAAASPVPIPLKTGGGCDFLLDPTQVLGTLGVGPGRSINLAVPNTASLAGLSLFFQAVQFDTSLFILSSNGLEAVIGT